MIALLVGAALAVCGDGVLDAGEACDDRNLTEGDGCDASCAAEHYYECEQPPTTFSTTVTWHGLGNCATAPATDLQGRGAAVTVPDWPAIALSPTGGDCWSAWSSGDAGHWMYFTVWQGGPASAGVEGRTSSALYSRAQCRNVSATASHLIDLQGQTQLYLGMRDNPCSDNRGSVPMNVMTVSHCVWKGDLDNDGVLNDDDLCPTVWNHLDGPYDHNEACVSEAATWDDAFVGRRAKVHRDAVVTNVVIAPYVEVGSGAVVGPDSVLGRYASVGARAELGAGTLLAANASVGPDVQGVVGGPVNGLTMGFGARVGPDADLGADVSLAAHTAVGEGAVLGSGSVLTREAAVGARTRIGAGSVFGGYASVGDDGVVGAFLRLRRAARIGSGARVGADVTIGRDSVAGDNISIGDGARIRHNVQLGDSSAVPAGTIVRAGTTLP